MTLLGVLHVHGEPPQYRIYIACLSPFTETLVPLVLKCLVKVYELVGKNKE